MPPTHRSPLVPLFYLSHSPNPGGGPVATGQGGAVTVYDLYPSQSHSVSLHCPHFQPLLFSLSRSVCPPLDKLLMKATAGAAALDVNVFFLSFSDLSDRWDG